VNYFSNCIETPLVPPHSYARSPVIGIFLVGGGPCATQLVTEGNVGMLVIQCGGFSCLLSLCRLPCYILAPFQF
jgi:hypothetical protein